MRKMGRERANWSDTDWTSHVNWDDFVDKIPMAVTFGKGLTPVKKTVYVNLWHQHTLEQILAHTKHIFRTETDLTRSMMNTVIVMYYNMFIRNKGIFNPKVSFFYDKIREMEEEWIKCDMVEAVRHTMKVNKIKRLKRLMSPEKERELNIGAINAIPEQYRDELRAVITEDLVSGNVYQIAHDDRYTKEQTYGDNG